MRTKITILSLVLAGTALSSPAEKFDCVADCWVRENNVTWNGGATSDAAEVNTGRFSALYGFSYALPAGMKVEKATLHLVTRRYKGGEINLYGYGNDFAENTKWENEATYINAATDPILSFTAAGQWNKDMTDTGINEDMRSLEKWVNDLDVTDYLKSLPATATRVNFLLSDATAQNQFFTKDNNGIDAYKYKAEDDTDAFYAHYDKEELMPYLEVTFAEDSAVSTVVLGTTADTHLRSDNGTGNGTATAMELKNLADGTVFYGLLQFKLPAEVLNTAQYEVSGATLRLVCVQNKGDRKMDLRDYPNNFTETSNYAAEEAFLLATMEEEPIETFEAKGQGTKAVSDKGIDADYRNVEAWTSNIDLTDFIAGKAAAGQGTINLMLTKQNLHNDAMKFATKEAQDLSSHTEEAANYTFTFAKEDLVPQLTIVYTKIEGGEEPEQPGDEDEETTTILGTAADTHVRSDNGLGYGNATAMEIKRIAAVPEEDKAEVNFYGLLHFQLPEALLSDDCQLTGASLRLVCVQNKGDRNMGLYDYSNLFTESSNFASEADYCAAAVETEPIATFQANGQGNKAMGDKGINEQYRNVEAWTTILDLTDYINGKILAGDPNAVLLLRKEGFHTDAMKFATKDADDISSHAEEAANYTFTFPKEDLVPQLTLTYTSKGLETGVEEVTVSVDLTDAAPEYYTLQGIRTANPEKGKIYIKVAGGKASKVIL